jgi:hypothetical protein
LSSFVRRPIAPEQQEAPKGAPEAWPNINMWLVTTFEGSHHLVR